MYFFLNWQKNIEDFFNNQSVMSLRNKILYNTRNKKGIEPLASMYDSHTLSVLQTWNLTQT